MKIPEGWKLVPEKETHQMRSAFREAEKGALLSGHDHIEAFFCGYMAMLAAAPTPTAQDSDALREQVRRYSDDIDTWRTRAFAAEDKLRERLKVIDLDENAALKAENERLRRDAERLEWLVENCLSATLINADTIALDRPSIDAAMKEKQ